MQAVVVRIPASQYYFIFCCCSFLFAFVVFILISFFGVVFIFKRINNPPISSFRYKITKGSRYMLSCVQKSSLFLCSHSTCLHNRAMFDPKNEVFYAAKHVYRVYITFLIICFSKCLKLLHLSHTKNELLK